MKLSPTEELKLIQSILNGANTAEKLLHVYQYFIRPGASWCMKCSSVVNSKYRELQQWYKENEARLISNIENEQKRS